MIGQAEMAARLDAERARVDAAFDDVSHRALRGIGEPLLGPLTYALSTTGKRLRPILCAAAWRAASGRPAGPGVYRLGCALEMVHTYSLVHDDLPCMDDDDLRRGRPTVHRVYGTELAILAAAALLPLAVQTVIEQGEALDLDADTTARLVIELCHSSGAEGMVGGQLLDLQAESRSVDAAELERIHRAKTGALLTTSLRIGALAAGATDALVSTLTAYGQALGLAFQITDDVLDVVGDVSSLGKAAGRDEALDKASYPAFFGVEGARALARARADEARASLGDAGSPELLALADYVVERTR